METVDETNLNTKNGKPFGAETKYIYQKKVSELERQVGLAVDLLATWRDATDDSCQCGYYEEAVSEENEEGWAVCNLCMVDKFLDKNLTKRHAERNGRGNG